MVFSRTKDLVSVVITNYNHGSYLRECLDSIKNQSYKNIEIIIVDDASTDNSLKVVKKWMKANKRTFPSKNSVTCISMPRNVGFSGAVSVGFFMAKGEFIAVQDSDDLSHPQRIEKQVEYIKDHPDVGVIGTNYASFWDGDFNPKPIKNWLRYGVSNIKSIYAKGGHCVSHGTILFRGSLFDKFGGLTRRVDGAEDYEFITKCLSEGVDNLQEVLYYYRNHINQRSKEFYSKKAPSIDIENMKVLLVIDSMNIGGTETHVLTLASELLRLGISVVILSNKGSLYDSFSKLGCTIYTMDFPLRIIDSYVEALKYKNRIKEIIAKENINIIHAHQSTSGALCIDAAREIGIPCVFTIHGLYYQDIASDVLKNSTKVISVSEPVFDWLQGFNIPSIVIPNGVDFTTFYPKKSTLIRDEQKISSDAFVVLYASRMAWGKAQVCENVIRVCRDLRNREKVDVHAFIVGDGPGFGDIKAMAERINEASSQKFIHLFGQKTNMLDFYANSDIIAGTGRVAIEAMACGKPVIATGNNGYFGLLNKDNFDEAWKIYFADHSSTKINNASFLYQDLRYALQNKILSQELGQASYQWAKDIFDIRKTSKDIVNVYKLAMQEVIASNKSS